MNALTAETGAPDTVLTHTSPIFFETSNSVHLFYTLISTLYIFGSGPSPEDALVGYELERLVEGQHDTAHVIDVLPSSPV